jgi:hypothetical protein
MLILEAATSGAIRQKIGLKFQDLISIDHGMRGIDELQLGSDDGRFCPQKSIEFL